ncbi:phage head closure protein [Bacteroides sp.]|uniref:phage head closure protein n=1 Tax=Bacteroides sp. TaxID=29523 RepID=UPI002FC946E2
MQAGLLTDLISFTRPESVRNSMGGHSETWLRVSDKRASVRFKSGGRKEVNSEPINTNVVTITIRYCKDITEKMRITYEGRKYRILSINRDRRQQSTVIEAEAINE